MESEFTENTVSSETLFRGAILTLRRDTVALPNGGRASREVVEHPGGVTILPLDRDGCVLLVSQYRYPIRQEILELPAGKLDPGEEFRTAALRELREEVGAEAGELTDLGPLYLTPGYSTETVRLYLARDLRLGDPHPDPDEFLRIVRIPLDRLCEEISAGRICDAKTVAGVFRVKLYLGQNP